MLITIEVDGGCLLQFGGFTDFVTKDDKRRTAVEAALKRDKNEGDSKKNGGKREERKWSSSWLRY